MAGKKAPGILWRNTSVIVRADIFSKAHEQGIDISNVCNKALADLLGVDYCQQQLDDVPVTRPVIIAQNGSPIEESTGVQGAHPPGNSTVINADDPTASTTVRNTKRQPKARPAAHETGQGSAPLPKKEAVVMSPPAHAAPAGKVKKPAAGKMPKDEGLKTFVSTMITRSDEGDAVISKDDMFQAFTRFCREHKVAPVPDRKAFTLALKNKFAFFDKTVNGIPSWVNARLK